MFSSADTIWVLIAAVLVFFMQAGFAMVETDFTRAKNAGNIIMKNLKELFHKKTVCPIVFLSLSVFMQTAKKPAVSGLFW